MEDTRDVTMDPMFAAIASRRQAADEHGQKPQDTAASKASKSKAQTQQEAKQEQSLITSYLVGCVQRPRALCLEPLESPASANDLQVQVCH